MTWAEVCDNPILQDLPFKIELNKWGNIEMSPARNRHGEFQATIAFLLQSQKPDGICITEVGVDTAENTKVPDVVWVSYERRRRVPHEFSWASAPEICVEILSHKLSGRTNAQETALPASGGRGVLALR